MSMRALFYVTSSFGMVPQLSSTCIEWTSAISRGHCCGALCQLKLGGFFWVGSVFVHLRFQRLHLHSMRHLHSFNRGLQPVWARDPAVWHAYARIVLVRTPLAHSFDDLVDVIIAESRSRQHKFDTRIECSSLEMPMTETRHCPSVRPLELRSACVIVPSIASSNVSFTSTIVAANFRVALAKACFSLRCPRTVVSCNDSVRFLTFRFSSARAPRDASQPC